MTYPKMKGKHFAKPIFTTKEYIEYRKSVGAVPKFTLESIILCYSKFLSENIQKAHRVSEIRGVLGNVGKLHSIGPSKLGLLTEFGVGAPATVLHLEELHAWGAKRFVIIGMAGAISDKLRIGDVVVCTKSVRDEGTSHHYIKNAKYAFASKDLTGTIYDSLFTKFDRLFMGPSWTIDAPYRETVDELRKYRGGVLTVEMESSALFALGGIRNIPTAAIFVVSDILSEKRWRPRFRSEIVMQNLLKAFVSIKEALVSLYE